MSRGCNFRMSDLLENLNKIDGVKEWDTSGEGADNDDHSKPM